MKEDLANEMLSTSNIEVRVMPPEDWAIYKTLRLQSLTESPDSFAARYKDELSYPDHEWKLRLSANGRAYSAYPLIALMESTPAGLAWGVIHNQGDTFAHVYQMWVAPDYRGRGVGKALINAIINWAKEYSLTEIRLGVTVSNHNAVSLYSAAGFQVYGALEELRPGSSLKSQSMSRPVEQNNS